MISLMICGVGIGTAAVGFFGLWLGRIKKHKSHAAIAIGSVIHMVGLVLQHSTFPALVDAVCAALYAYWWWTKGGGDDTKKRLRRWTRKFVPARRTAPSAA